MGHWVSQIQAGSGLVTDGKAVPAVSVLHIMVNITQVPWPVVGLISVDVVNGVLWIFAGHPLPHQSMRLNQLLVVFGVVIDLAIAAVKTTQWAKPWSSSAVNLAC